MRNISSQIGEQMQLAWCTFQVMQGSITGQMNVELFSSLKKSTEYLIPVKKEKIITVHSFLL